MYVSGDYLIGDSEKDFECFMMEVHVKLRQYMFLEDRLLGSAGLFQRTIGTDNFNLKHFYENVKLYENVKKSKNLLNLNMEIINWIDSFSNINYLDIEI